MRIDPQQDIRIRHYIDLVMQDFDERHKATFEAIEVIKVQVAKIPVIEEKIDKLDADMQAVKAVLKATNKDLKDHKKRIVQLEAGTR